MSRRSREQKAWRKQIFEMQRWQQVRGLAGAIMCEFGDLGIHWPQWRNLLLHELLGVRWALSGTETERTKEHAEMFKGSQA